MAARIIRSLMIVLLGTPMAFGISSAAGSVLDLVASDDAGLTVRLAIPQLDVGPVATERGPFTSIKVDRFGFTGQVGAPRLPVLRSLIDLPLGARWTVTVEEPVFREVALEAPVVPLQPPRPKTGEPAPPFAYDADAYATAGYGSGPLAFMEEAGRLRGHRLGMLIIRPVAYDPASEKIRILESATIHIRLEGADLAATAERHGRYRSETFERLLRMATLNGAQERYLPAGEIGFLVISDPSLTWDSDLAALIAWKEQRGFHVTHVSTDETGPTKEAILAYIQDAYDNWEIPPTFVLLVGDTPDPPHWTGSGSGNPPTDLNYTLLEGSDYFPDIAIGRFSVTNPTQLHNIVAKTLSFERIEWSGNDDWEKHAVFMASEDNYTVSEGTHNYVISNYLDPLGYTSDKLYSHTYNATTQQVRDAFNEGRSQGTYSGHGSETSWADGPPFDQTDVNNLTNTVYPFVQSYACVTGYFPLSECFGETWIRAAHGAVAFWGSSVNSYWTEDDILEKRLYEGFFADVYPEHLVNQTWIGGMTNYAKLRFYEYFGDSGTTRRYFEMYNILGDASIDVWTNIPEAAEIIAPETLMAGETEFEVTVAGFPYAMISVRKDDGGNEIFMTAWADDSGHAVVSLPEPLTPGGLTLAVTAHDLEPYFGTIQVIQPSGPYLIVESYQIDDALGDGNGIAGAGETVDLDVMLENVGIEAATGVVGTIESVDPYVTIVNGEAAYGEIPAGEIGGCIEPYRISVAGDVPDQHEAAFTLLIQANEGEWSGEFAIVIEAAELVDGGVLVDDSAPGGNGDGGVDPDETVYLQLWVGNVGHRAAGALSGALSCEDPNVIVLDGQGECLGVPVGGEGLLSAFQIEVLPTCPSPSVVTLQIALTGEDGFEADLEYEISIGAFFDDVEADRGWTLGAGDDDASSGGWIRDDPIGTTYNGQPCQPEDDHTPAGTICFVTGNGSVGGSAGEADVDGGKTTLLSPLFDLSDALEAGIEYWRWYTNDLGNNPGEDFWDVEVSSDGGGSWVSLEHTQESANSWNSYAFNLGDYVELSDQVQIRFVASDEGGGSLVEAAVDDFTLTAIREPVTGAPSGTMQEESGLVSCEPNPFNPRARIVYRTSSQTRVQLGVFDVTGRQVRSLVDRTVPAGEHAVLFDGRDDAGRSLASGVYFVRFDTREMLQVRQIALLK